MSVKEAYRKAVLVIIYYLSRCREVGFIKGEFRMTLQTKGFDEAQDLIESNYKVEGWEIMLFFQNENMPVEIATQLTNLILIVQRENYFIIESK